ncbi:MAG: alpha/beta hydrolase-fold protein [Saprospiraceae bacterium]|nr:alpha/beta hydrolase-fold protein [Saprospiraceae bacterium]MDW8229580.1 alpha/beta hydrolase-fold protein [Saprospiraceae bacterium]
MKLLHRITCTLFWVFALAPLWLKAELTIVVNSLPANTPASEPIYISGSFNGWLAAEPATRLERNISGKFQVKIQPPVGPLHFTFTRGSWSIAEGNTTGEYQAVHVVHYNGQSQTLTVDIPSWRISNQTAFNSDKKGTVAVVNDSFFMPQLNRTRRIYAYLPPNYYANSRRYPVLYMQDGQTLFQKSASMADEWEVDESLDKLVNEGNYGCIVIGIENGGVNQMNEYSPWFNSIHAAGGQGASYMSFIVNTLKPFVDLHFRTSPDREYTGIGGSGFGALISLYGAMEYQHVFSKVLLFSPSFWFSDMAVQNHILGRGKRNAMRMYFLVGEQEPVYILQSTRNAMNRLREVGFGDHEMNLLIHPDGRGTISFWQKRYPAAYEWLFAGLTTTSTDPRRFDEKRVSVTVYPNPATDWVRVRTTGANEWLQVQIVGANGAVVRDVLAYEEETIAVYDLPRGAYWVRIRSEDAAQWQTTSLIKR